MSHLRRRYATKHSNSPNLPIATNRTPGPPYSGVPDLCTKLQGTFHLSLEQFNRDNDNAHFLVDELFPWHAPSALPAAVIEGFPSSDMDWAILMEEERHLW
jgi:hypothetical protein